ncbi:MAG: hypothetical protein CMM53_03515 [Rhodospirillaceae bacterium]|nr:hypothetical protein [Rhodospirillaceae bacterium]|tara:strand:- start:418 stop:663 length:246 start_codon:yes stop_codon:yes gene_type:complete
MASVILNSIETFDGDRCVDIFEREDGTFGFEEFRRDPETRTGWFKTGYFGGNIFLDEMSALVAARGSVKWLDLKMKILEKR